MIPLPTHDDDVQDDGAAGAAGARAVATLSPRLSTLLVGGVAQGGIVCMCLAAILLAVWRGG